MSRHRKENYTLLQRLVSYFRRYRCPDKNGNSQEGRHDVEVEKISMKLSRNRRTAPYDASILATFDSDGDENLISRDMVEKLMGPGIMLRPGGNGIVSIEFNIVGQRQRFETSHHIADIPRPDKILFSRRRTRKDAVGTSPLELHIPHRDALSKDCTCYTGDVCQLGDSNNAGDYSWYCPVVEETDQCPAPLAGVQALSPSRRQGDEDTDDTRREGDMHPSRLDDSGKTIVSPDADGHDRSGAPLRDRTVDKDLSVESSSVPQQHQIPFGPSETRGPTADEEKSIVERKELSTQLGQDMREPDSPRLQQRSLIQIDHDKQASSYGSVPLSQPATSVSSTQLSTSPGQAAFTNSTSVHSHENVVTRDERQVQQRDVALRVEVPGQRERLQERVGYTPENECFPSQQREYVLSASAQFYQSSGKEGMVGSAGHGGTLRNSAGDDNRPRMGGYDEGSDDSQNLDKEDYPDLPFPDDYWTYDAEAKNYYHMDREEDGRETKVWYPLEFL